MNTEAIAPFEVPGNLALPLLQPIQGQASICAFRIAAISEEFLIRTLPPQNRSSVLAAFAVWHGITDHVVDESVEHDDENDVMSAAVHHCVKDMEIVHPFLAKSERLIRAAWPYETMLCDQIAEGDSKKALFACYPVLGEFPDMVPDNPIGNIRLITNIPSLAARVDMDTDSPHLISMAQIIHIMSMNPASPPAIAMVPGGAGNTLFGYAYLNFGSAPGTAG